MTSAVTQFDNHILFLLVFHGNYVHILYCFQDKARFHSKTAIFHTIL